MDLEMKGWNGLGVVGTIYEEEDENSAFSTIPSLESSPSNTPPQLSKEEPPWASGRRHDTDVVIHVQGSCFRLHKQALIARSPYFKRQLAEFPEITLSPPLNITPQTFSLVTDFCYGTHIAVTPFNVAALRAAAELLGMTETSGTGGENLLELTEAYFRRFVAVNKESATVVLKSCFSLLPEASPLVSRCIEALSLTAEGDGDFRCLDGFKNVAIHDLKSVVESVSQRLTECHDLLYRIIDIFLKENIGALSEEEKIQICNYIDCSILSSQVLMHAVQNPRMPLRFVVQAMFLQQLNTRHSIISAADNHHHYRDCHHKKETAAAATTLGAILQRDAALRQVSQLKAVMTTTNSRIQTLEEELSGMRKLLAEPVSSVKNRIDSGRSASFRFCSDGGKVERGQIGSISSLSYRDVAAKVRAAEGSSSSEGSSEAIEVNFGRRLMNGLKSAFRLQKKKSESKVRKDDALHRRSRSQV